MWRKLMPLGVISHISLTSHLHLYQMSSTHCAEEQEQTNSNTNNFNTETLVNQFKHLNFSTTGSIFDSTSFDKISVLDSQAIKELLSAQAGPISLELCTGFASGYTLKKGLKGLTLLLGSAFLLSQALTHTGYIETKELNNYQDEIATRLKKEFEQAHNPEVAQDLLTRTDPLDKDRTVTGTGAELAAVMERLQHDFPTGMFFLPGFLAGFLIG